MVMALVVTTAISAVRGGTITLKVFDENGDGKPCDFARFKAVSNCTLHKGWDTDCLLNADSYDCLAMQPLRAEGDAVAFAAKGPCVLSVVWPTQNTGYNNLLLDNEGKGWQSDAAVVFNLQAAKDTWRQLNDALNARPDYAQSDAFAALRLEAESLLRGADTAAADCEKGKRGQIALDRALQAYNLLLGEYGVQRAQRTKGQGLYWGFTIDRVARDNSKYLLPIQELVGNSDRGWARIVCDRGNSPSQYKAIVSEAKSHGIHVLLQILDSVDNKKTSLEESNRRLKDYVDAFRETVDAYEIGNEVNMKPFPKMVEKMEYAASYVKQAAPQSQVAVVLYWQLGTGYGNRGDGSYTTFDYVNHVMRTSAVLTRGVDLWLVSMYHEGYPMGPVCFDQLMTRLQKAFPGKKIGIGELDYWLPKTDHVWWWGPQDMAPEKTRPEFLRWHYAAAAGFERSILGGFWWGYIPEMASHNALWDSARQLFQEINR
jgi:hypothetical protein